LESDIKSPVFRFLASRSDMRQFSPNPDTKY
jgi:hypothetical protein